MRRLTPDSRGMLKPRAPTIRTAGHIQAYSRPNPALHRIDKLREGAVPRICVTRKQGGIGDVLMTLPTVKAIHNKYHTKIDYGTDFTYLDGALRKVLLNNPYIENVISWQDATGEKYDAVVDLTCPCIRHEKPGAEPINRIDLFARHAGITLHDHSIDFFTTEEERLWAQEYVMKYNLDRHTLILVNPSSSTVRRDCPPGKIHRAVTGILTLRKDIRALVVTHDSDSVKTDWNFSNVHRLHNYDVRQIAAIMPFCKLVICPDSALLHVASALHMPTVTIFGPTDPRARVNYHPEAVAIWPGKELRNYPVWYEDPGDGYLCWKRLEEDVIVKTALAILEGNTLPPSRDLVTFGDYSESNQFYDIV